MITTKPDLYNAVQRGCFITVFKTTKDQEKLSVIQLVHKVLISWTIFQELALNNFKNLMSAVVLNNKFQF